MKKREEIEEKFKWDLSQYAKSVEDCEEKCKKLKSFLPNFKKYEGKLNTAETIFECLEKQSKIVVEISNSRFSLHVQRTRTQQMMYLLNLMIKLMI